jgi:hypothetical protein
MISTSKQPLFTSFFMITGFIIAALGTLVLFAQCMEWFSFGNWNSVSVQYAFGYFDIRVPHFISICFSRLPLSVTLLVVGGLTAAVAKRRSLWNRRGPSGAKNRRILL